MEPKTGLNFSSLRAYQHSYSELLHPSVSHPSLLFLFFFLSSSSSLLPTVYLHSHHYLLPPSPVRFPAPNKVDALNSDPLIRFTHHTTHYTHTHFQLHPPNTSTPAASNQHRPQQFAIAERHHFYTINKYPQIISIYF